MAAIGRIVKGLLLADSRGSLCSPKAGFGRIRLLALRAAYGLRTHATGHQLSLAEVDWPEEPLAAVGGIRTIDPKRTLLTEAWQ